MTNNPYDPGYQGPVDPEDVTPQTSERFPSAAAHGDPASCGPPPAPEAAGSQPGTEQVKDAVLAGAGEMKDTALTGAGSATEDDRLDMGGNDR